MRRMAFAAGATLVAVGLGAVGLRYQSHVTVGQNVFVNPAGIIDAFSTPTIAVNPRRPSNLAAVYREDRPALTAQLSWSTDDGATWRRSPLPLPAGQDRPFFPDAAFGSDGVLYLTYVNLTGTGNVPGNLWVARSTDGGQTVVGATLVATGMTFQPRLALGPDGTLHLTWLQVDRRGQAGLTGSQVRVDTARSSDGGLTWSAPIPASEADGRLVGAASAMVDRGTVTLAYERFGTTAPTLGSGGTTPEPQSYDLLVTRSVDGGVTFPPPVVVASGVTTGQRFSLFFPEFPSLALAPDNTMYLAWAQGRGRGNDIAVARSKDAGLTWSAPVRANDNRPDDGTSRSLPTMSVAANGRVDVVFIDKRGDPTGIYAEAYLASSGDGAKSFHDVRLSAAGFDTRVGPTFGGGLPPDLGSHLGIVSDRAGVHAAWSDSRLGNQTTGRQDIVTARVQVPGSGLGSRKWLVLAAGLLLVAAAVIAFLGLLGRRRGRSE